LPYPQRLRALLTPLRPYAGSGLQRLARRSGLTRLLGPELAAMEKLLPALGAEAFGPDPQGLIPARGPRRARVGLVLGCVQRLFDPEVNAAAIRVLTANGIEVLIPRDQGCCGAVSHHQGEEAQTQQLAEALIKSFEAASAEPLDAVLVAASGCGHTLKHYGEILAPEANPQRPGASETAPSNRSDWAASAPPSTNPASFASQVADIQEFLDRVGPSEAFRAALQPLRHADGTPATTARPLRLAYHDACHMLHGQGLREQPRSLLRSIPHVRLVEASEAGVCCGSAGIYNLVQPEEAAELGRIKAADLSGTGADLAVSANIGCTLQIRSHMESTPRPIPVLHPVQLLQRSLEGG
jgi:glycolate oxidase iron-sulfur subunit